MGAEDRGGLTGWARGAIAAPPAGVPKRCRAAETPERASGGSAGRAHALATAGADEGIHLVDLGDQPGPARRATPSRRQLGADHCFRFGRVRGSSRATRVLAVEQRSVLSGIGDVIWPSR
jgi:hypothetical protein